MGVGRTLTNGTPRTPEQWQRAGLRARAEGIEVRQLAGSDQWIASSGSQSDVAHRLEVGWGGYVSCGCRAASFGHPCKHVAALMVRLGTLVLPEQMELEAGGE